MPDETLQGLDDLWQAVFGEQPSIRADPGLMLEILIRHLPTPGPYELGGPPREDEDDSQAA